MKIYKQTTEFTGASSSLLMVIHHYKPEFELSKENEFNIWRKSVNLPTRACSIYGLANYAYDKGIKVEVYVGQQEYEFPDYRFKGYKKQEIDAAKYTEELYLKELKKRGIKIKVGEFSINDVKELISNGKIVMIRLDAGIFRDIKPSSSYVVVTGFKDKKYTLYDPYSGNVVLSEQEMQESFDNLKIKRKRDHRMIVFG